MTAAQHYLCSLAMPALHSDASTGSLVGQRATTKNMCIMQVHKPYASRKWQQTVCLEVPSTAVSAAELVPGLVNIAKHAVNRRKQQRQSPPEN